MNEAAVLNVVDKIADKLAVPATEILSAYAQSGGVMLLPELIVSGVVLSVTVILCIVTAYKACKESKYAYPMQNEYVLPLTFYCAITVPPMFVLTRALASFMLWLQNPKAYAIVTLMDKLF